jgi:hypothetical protein
MPVQLRDIHGLDPISWWPPATGLWVGLLLAVLLLILLILLVRHLVLYPPGSWRSAARSAVRELQRKRSQLSPKETVSQLSELLRRISMARFGREGLASLTGKEWLEWLQQSDSSGFPWSEKGAILINLPYAPDDQKVEPGEIDELAGATLDLIGSSREDARRQKLRWKVASDV